MSRPTRWVTETEPGHSEWYIERFRRMAADGTDLAGEARLVDTLLPRAARVLDAGCGPGRVGAELAARGHRVVGVDADAALIEAARADHPGPRWLVADLAVLDLSSAGEPEPFDAVVVVGNVLPFVAPGSETEVVRRLAAQLCPGGVLIAGFGAGRGYELEDFDVQLALSGLVLEHRFATFELQPWHPDADFAVTIARKPSGTR